MDGRRSTWAKGLSLPLIGVAAALLLSCGGGGGGGPATLAATFDLAIRGSGSLRGSAELRLFSDGKVEGEGSLSDGISQLGLTFRGEKRGEGLSGTLSLSSGAEGEFALDLLSEQVLSGWFRVGGGQALTLGAMAGLMRPEHTTAQQGEVQFPLRLVHFEERFGDSQLAVGIGELSSSGVYEVRLVVADFATPEPDLSLYILNGTLVGDRLSGRVFPFGEVSEVGRFIGMRGEQGDFYGQTVFAGGLGEGFFAIPLSDLTPQFPDTSPGSVVRALDSSLTLSGSTGDLSGQMRIYLRADGSVTGAGSALDQSENLLFLTLTGNTQGEGFAGPLTVGERSLSLSATPLGVGFGLSVQELDVELVGLAVSAIPKELRGEFHRFHLHLSGERRGAGLLDMQFTETLPRPLSGYALVRDSVGAEKLFELRGEADFSGSGPDSSGVYSGDLFTATQPPQRVGGFFANQQGIPTRAPIGGQFAEEGESSLILSGLPLSD